MVSLWGYVAVYMLVLYPSVVSAQTVSESWLRVATSACGGGVSAQASGDLEAGIFRRLRAVSADVNGIYNLADINTLLEQFDVADRSSEARSYRECLLNLMQMASQSSDLPPREIRLDSPVSVSPLETIRRGQRFVMVPHDAVAISNPSIIFNLDNITSDSSKMPYIDFKWSNSETGDQQTAYAYQGQLIKLFDKCSITPFKLDVENAQASFLSNC